MVYLYFEDDGSPPGDWRQIVEYLKFLTFHRTFLAQYCMVYKPKCENKSILTIFIYSNYVRDYDMIGGVLYADVMWNGKVIQLELKPEEGVSYTIENGKFEPVSQKFLSKKCSVWSGYE